MQVGASDRKVLSGVAIFMGAAFVLMLLFGRIGDEASVIPSSYSSGSGGARAAYLLLQDAGYSVERLEESPAALDGLGEGTLVILAEPAMEPSRRERTALRAFVRRGGRILFCGGAIHAFFPEVSVSETSDPQWIEQRASFPSGISREAAAIVLRVEAYWGRLSSVQLALYGTDAKPAVVAWRLGKGEVIWWAGATPLTNDGITKAGNLHFFLNSIAGLRAPSRVYWDEYYHGQRGSLGAYIGRTPVVWAGVQAALLALAALFTFSRRSGPVMNPVAGSRLSPLEFVDTMGGLYRRAGAGSVAVSVAYRHLRLELSRTLGLAPAVEDGALAEAASSRLGLDRVSLYKALREASSASHVPRLRAREALRLVQSLEWFGAKLGKRKESNWNI